MRIAPLFRLPALALAVGLALSPAGQAASLTFNIDNTHSFANWQLRHVVAITSGTFWDIKGNVVLDTDNLSSSSVEAIISTYSLNSSHLRRDVHVLTDEFLDARNYPEMKFVSTSVKPVTAEKGAMTGQLTLHGVTKPVILDYEILGVGKDPWGGMRIGLKGTTRIKRSEFGITKYTPTGPVGDEVDINLLIEGIRMTADGQPWNAKKAGDAAAARKAAAEKTKAATPAASTAAPAKKEESVEDQLKRKLMDFLD